jgi:hypothetical protein
MKDRTPTATPAESHEVRLVITHPPATVKRQPGPPRTRRIGRFSTGIEQRPDAPATLRLGSFADGYDACT